MLRHSETLQILTGAATMATLVAVIVLSYATGTASQQGSGYPLYAQFNQVDGIAEGSEVRLAGVQVGVVRAVTLAESLRVRLTLEMDRHVVLPADTSAAVHTEGIFGAKYVTLLPGAEEDTIKPQGVIAYTQGSMVIGDLLQLIVDQSKARLTQDSEN